MTLEELNKALLKAAAENNINDVNEALSNGAEVDVSNDWGYTPLIIAAYNGHLALVNILTEAGAKLDAYEHLGFTALMAAAQNGHSDITTRLIDAGADHKLENDYGDTALIAAIIHEKSAVVNQLINLKNHHGQTALMIAVDKNDIDTISLLIKAGANLNLRSYNDYTAIMAAAQNGKSAIVDKLIKAGSNLDLQVLGHTALIFAAKNSHIDVVDKLIKARADLNLRDNNGQTALMSSAKKGHLEVLDKLIKARANIDLQSDQGNTALMDAAAQGNIKMLDKLIAARANIDLQNDYGDTALIMATERDNLDVIGKLIEAGANLNLQDSFGFTALMDAAQNNNLDIVDLLIKAHANLNLKDNNGYTAIMRAAQTERPDIVKSLLLAGADISNIRPLHFDQNLTDSQAECVQLIKLAHLADDILIQGDLVQNQKLTYGQASIDFGFILSRIQSKAKLGFQATIDLVKSLLKEGDDITNIKSLDFGQELADSQTKCVQIISDNILLHSEKFTYDEKSIDFESILSKIQSQLTLDFQAIIDFECSKLIAIENDSNMHITLPPIKTYIQTIMEQNFPPKISDEIKSLFEYYIERSDMKDQEFLCTYVEYLFKFNDKIMSTRYSREDLSAILQEKSVHLFKIISKININILEEYIASDNGALTTLLASIANIKEEVTEEATILGKQDPEDVDCSPFKKKARAEGNNKRDIEDLDHSPFKKKARAEDVNEDQEDDLVYGNINDTMRHDLPTPEPLNDDMTITGGTTDESTSSDS